MLKRVVLLRLIALLLLLTLIAISCSVEYEEFSSNDCRYQVFTVGFSNAAKSIITTRFQEAIVFKTCGPNPPGMEMFPSGPNDGK